MDWVWQRFWRIFAFFRGAVLDNEFDAEIASHLDFAIEENLRKGMPEEEARRVALIQFGGVEQTKEQHRETRGLPMLEILTQDLRYTNRTLRKDRAFTLIAILILALGIGANVAVFSVVNTLLLRPLPFHDSERLTWLSGNDGTGGLSSVTYMVDAYEAFQRENQSFQQLTAFVPFLSDFKLTGMGEPRDVAGMVVAGNFFQTLGIEPVLGRAFTPEDTKKGAQLKVLLTDGFWREQFAADPGIVGRTIVLNNKPAIVAGVLPLTFDFGSVFSPGSKKDLFVPIVMDDIRTFGHMLSAIGRLKPGVSVSRAQAEADILFPQLRGSGNPSWGSDIHTRITGLKEYVSGNLRRSLLVLWGAVGLILLIVCVNLSNLLMARLASREKEFALRSAIGASPGRLIRQLLTESLALSAMGAILGVALAYAVVSYLSHQGSIALPLLHGVRVDGVALAWSLLITLIVGVLFGLAPGLMISSKNVQQALKESGRGTSEGGKKGRLRSAMVISEVALACVLLVGAGLLLRSFLHILDVDLGFQPSQAGALKLDFDDSVDRTKQAAIFQETLRRVNEIPGIEAAGISDMLPLDRNRSWDLSAKGSVHAPDENLDAFVRIVTPGYLQAMGIRLREGRDFTWQDAAKSEQVIIINEAAARRHWPGESPIGHLAQGIGQGDTTVIGVIADVHQTSLEELATPEAFVPVTQGNPDGAQLVVRSKLAPSVVASSVLSVLREMNPGQPMVDYQPIQRLVDHSVSPRRFFVLLVGIFAALGLLLAALGIYGVISYSVARRTQEIGIRMALGASPGRVQRDVLTGTIRLALVGIAIGGVASFAVSQLIASLLFKTQPTDPTTFVGVVVTLIGVAVMAGYLPALRATRVDPMSALRGD